MSAFYVSNVESYLQRNGVWPLFCANVVEPAARRGERVHPARRRTHELVQPDGVGNGSLSGELTFCTTSPVKQREIGPKCPSRNQP